MPLAPAAAAAAEDDDDEDDVLKRSTTVSNQSHRYGNSHAIWEHTVLPATRQR